ncbi:hypothetical protein BJX66DRAFT_332961 [Aspergillus keveii]|uniref:DUF7730 domain-containing protein n=1 Tax=Aspergillus keveii TaxID=714993 RepID=A0ABR4GK95_9EURO
MARTKAEAYYSLAHNYLTAYRRNQARGGGGRVEQWRRRRSLLPPITPTSNSNPNTNTNTNTNNRASTIATRCKTLRAIASQTDCALLSRLPPEIRHMIWVAVLGDLEIEIVTRRHRRVIPYFYDECGCVDKRAHTCPFLGCIVHGHESDENRDREQEARLRLLAVVLTCRRIYTETLPVLYSTNTFTFATFEIIHLFRSSIPSSHWNLIRFVHVHTYNILWHHRGRADVFRISCEDVLSLTALREFTIQVRRSRSGLLGVVGFEGVVGALEVLKGLKRRGVRLIIEVEVDGKGNGEMHVADVRELLERKGMEGWVVRAVEGSE